MCVEIPVSLRNELVSEFLVIQENLGVFLETFICYETTCQPVVHSLLGIPPFPIVEKDLIGAVGDVERVGTARPDIDVTHDLTVLFQENHHVASRCLCLDEDLRLVSPGRVVMAIG